VKKRNHPTVFNRVKLQHKQLYGYIVCLVMVCFGTTLILSYGFGVSVPGLKTAGPGLFILGISLVFIGMGVISLQWRAGQLFKNGNRIILPITVFLIGSFVFFEFYQLLANQQHEELAKKVARETGISRAVLSAELEKYLTAIDRMYNRIEHNDQFLKTAWEADVNNYLRDLPAFSAFAIKNKNGNFSNVISQRGSSLAVSLTKLKRCEGQGQFIRLESSDGDALCLQFPLGNSLGKLTALISIKQLATEALSETLEKGYGITISEGGKILFAGNTGNNALNKVWGKTSDVVTPNFKWELRQWPDTSIKNLTITSYPLMVLMIGMIVSLLIAILVWLLQATRHKQQLLQNEVALRKEAEEQTQVLIQRSQNAMLVVGEAGRVVFSNNAACKLFEYYDNELSLMSIDKLIPVCPLADIENENHQWSQKNGMQFPVKENNSVLITKFGEEKPINVNVSLVRYNDCECLLFNIYDISQQQQIEKQLREQATSIQMLLDVTTVVSEQQGTEKALQSCVNIICSTLGWSIGHVYMPNDDESLLLPTDIWYQADEQLTKEFYDITMKSNFALGVGLPGRIWVSGKPIWIDDVEIDPNFPRNKKADLTHIHAGTGFAVKIMGKTIAVLEFFDTKIKGRDDNLLLTFNMLGEQISRLFERKEAQDALFASEQRTNLILQSIDEGIYGIDLNGKITFVNQMGANLLGYQADDLIGNTMHTLLSSNDENSDISPIANSPVFVSFSDGNIHNMPNLYIQQKNGKKIPVDCVNTPIKNKGKIVGAVITLQDVTDRKINEEQLKQKSIELEHLNTKLQNNNNELEELAYITSHDLKAPLRAIEHLSEWIVEDNKDKLDGTSKKNLQLLQQRVSRMAGLVDGILQYCRSGRSQVDVTDVDIRHLLDEVVNSLNVPEDYSIRYEGPFPTIESSHLLLTQVFSNLIGNAIQHRGGDGNHIDISYEDIGGYHKFNVIDNGPGIEVNLHDKVFEIFYTQGKQSDDEGTGVGLAIVKKIITSQDGEIVLDSDIGKGTTISFTWPKHPSMRDPNNV
tara:strand:- start:14841 stop:17948 length:3108 start_codon:yes stop_codon:yes gene_type:complete